MQKLIIALIMVAFLVHRILKLIQKKNKLHKINQKKAKSLLKSLQKNDYAPGYIFGILRRTDPFVFEELLLLCYQKKGYKIKHNKAYTGDGGIDGTFFDKHGNKFLIQAKRYKNTITPRHVSDFAAVVAQQKATGGFFVHTGRTGGKSYDNRAANIRFVSGYKLLRLLAC